MCVMKGIVRYAVIAGLVGGTAALVAGPDRIAALFQQTRQKLNSAIDARIEDPVALRAQLKSLEGEYPRRIEAVKRDLAEVQAQRTQLQRELEVSERVVDLARADAEQIQQLIARGEAAQSSGITEASTGASPKLVRVVFGKESMDMDSAYARANQIRQVNNAYVARAEDIRRDMGYLGQQEERLGKLLGQLQAEHAEFQTQLWQLDRQVDTIARNERLIAMMEKREKTISDQSRYSAGSLEHVHARFADIRTRQEARLETLGTSTATTNYEDRAKFDLDAKRALRDGKLPGLKELAPTPTVIEIHPESQEDDDQREGLAHGRRL